jgi:hypothetical protein
MWLVVGVTREGFAGWLDIEVLTKAATGDGMKPVVDEFHRVGVRAKGFARGRFVPVLGAAQRQQRTEPVAADAEAPRESADEVTGFALDVGGTHDAGEGKFGRSGNDFFTTEARAHGDFAASGYSINATRWAE